MPLLSPSLIKENKNLIASKQRVKQAKELDTLKKAEIEQRKSENPDQFLSDQLNNTD